MANLEEEYTADDRPKSRIDPSAQPGVTPDERFADVRGATPQLGALLILWADRDVAYAQRDKALGREQIEAARSFRLREVNDLPVEQRARAAMRVLAWYPPEHGQGSR